MTLYAKVPAGLIMFLMVLCPVQANAQARGQEDARESDTPGHVISGSPLLLLAGWFNAEYERKVAGNMTWGLAAGWQDLSDDDYTSVSAFLRFYPQKSAYTGLYLGSRGGVHRVNEALDGDAGGSSYTGFGLGIDIGYSWLLGPGDTFFLALGVGGTYIFRDLGNASRTIPTLRILDVGIAF
jgi:hypothetical protein